MGLANVPLGGVVERDRGGASSINRIKSLNSESSSESCDSVFTALRAV